MVNCQVYPPKILVANGRLCLGDLGRAIDTAAPAQLPLTRSCSCLCGGVIQLCRPEVDALRQQYFSYLAPELCGVSGAPPDSLAHATYKSDLWSLGCVLFELCTGAVPFPSKTYQQHQKV